MSTKKHFKHTADVSSVEEAEEYRMGVFSDFSGLLRKLHDPETPLESIRGLNERANQLLKTRRAWEYRIKELGGPDHLQTSARLQSVSMNINGFRYFGRAKDLPDVIEQLETQKKTRGTINEQEDVEKKHMKKVDTLNAVSFNSSYYGDDIPIEQVKSKLLPFDEYSTGLDTKEIEKIVVEMKRSQLLAKLELKNKLSSQNY